MGKLTHWAVVFFLLALPYGLLGYGEAAGTSTTIAKYFFWSALLFATVALTGAALRRS